MYISATSLPHLLPPDAYYSERQFRAEQQSLFGTCWHAVATWSQLARPGDFVTLNLCGTPIQLRNFAGELRALSNVCAHRHCLLTSNKAGTSPTMRCQYHGWEYGADGRTRRIPCAKEFVPLDREVHRLPSYRIERRGQLVFVSLASDGPSLADQLGDLDELVAARFGEAWHESLAWESSFDVNWKIPIENSLEAYHVPSVHPETFREYPGPDRSRHVLLPRRTAFGTQLPFSPHSRVDGWFQRGEGWFIRRMGAAPTGEYWQHHIFPNLLFSFTDAISLCHSILPTGPRSCLAIVRQFGRGGSCESPFRGALARAWGRMTAAITKRILQEDIRLFRDLQCGLEASPHPGRLGACEERIHAFQQFVSTECSWSLRGCCPGGESPADAAALYNVESSS